MIMAEQPAVFAGATGERPRLTVWLLHPRIRHEHVLSTPEQACPNGS